METKLKKNLAVQVIKDHNISKIEVYYSGGGDDGCIDSVTYYDHNENSIDVIMNNEIEPEWDDLLYNLLNEHIEWDWINNEGGYGTINIDVHTGKVSIDHSQRIVEDYNYDPVESEIEKVLNGSS